MSNQTDILCRKFPAVNALIKSYGNFSIEEYIREITHYNFPEILSSEDLLYEVYTYLNPVFGEEKAIAATELLKRRRCLSTSCHHHLSFDYEMVQDVILYEQWLRRNGETGQIVPVFAASDVQLQNSAYPRGMIIHDCNLPEKKLYIPVFPHKMKHTCAGGVGQFTADMIARTKDRILRLKKNGTLSEEMYEVVSEYCNNILLSEDVQKCRSYREQTTVANAMLSQKYFTDRSPQYMWIDLETVTSGLLQKDLKNENSLPNRIMFCKELRESVIKHLEGISGCWTGEKSGTHFFWGLDNRAVLFSMRLKEQDNKLMLTGVDSSGCKFDIPFNEESVCINLKERKIIPSLFLDFLEIYFLRNYTVLGGYYQPTYLGRIQKGLVNALEETGMFSEESQIIRQKISYMTLGLTYLTESHESTIFPVSSGELLARPLSTAEIDEKLKITVKNAISMISL